MFAGCWGLSDRHVVGRGGAAMRPGDPLPVIYGRDCFVAVAEVRRKREDHRLGLRGLALGMIAVVDKKPYT